MTIPHLQPITPAPARLASPPPKVLLICTGNAARSVIAGAALRTRAPWLEVQTAGTLVIDGQPMSGRTRAALVHVGLEPPRHASRQATPPVLAWADIIVGLSTEHIGWIRREHPDVAHRSATLVRLARDLHAGADLAARVRALDLAHVALEAWEDVDDPGGGDEEAFVDCARHIVPLVDRLAGALDANPRAAGAPGR